MEHETKFIGNIMKRFIIATALTLAAASSAMATTYGADYNTSLPSTTQVEIRALVPEADLGNLTIAQVAQFNDLFSNSDLRRAGENPAGRIRAILAQNS
jgi:Spy/CpxP family protein refolding chaperone